MKCTTNYCRNAAIDGRSLCAKCRSRAYKQKYPFRYHYNALRNNARRRGIAFSLSFARYKELWSNHPIACKEKLLNDEKCRFEVDRIDVRQGYTDTNVQLLLKTMNVEKYHAYDKFILTVDWRKTQELGKESEAPF